jgi:Uncharacterized protein conserved in bacteria (DUF2066)
MPIRHIFGALFVGLAFFGLGAALAPGNGNARVDVFTVSDVEVDITADTAAAAREAAHAEGHVLAMQRLLARLLPREELARMRPLELTEILEYVRDFEVDDERTSDVRYLARLTFRFKSDAVRNLLRSEGLLFAETQSKPVLVLAVYGPAGEALLWEDGNPWARAWALRQRGEGLVPLQVPLGDLGDVASVDANQALSGDRERLATLATRYGTEDVLVTQAVLSGDAESGLATLQVGSSRIGTQQLQTMLASYTQKLGETLEELLTRAANAVDADVQEAWKQRNLLRPGSERRIVVSVPIAGLADWLEVKRRLGGVAAVQKSEVTLISRTRTEVDLTFVGDEQQLVLALAQRDLSLTLNPVSGWQIRLSEARAAASAPTTPALTTLAPSEVISPSVPENASPPENANPPGSTSPPGGTSPPASN